MGPSTFNFAEVARLAEEAGAMQRVPEVMEAMRSAQTLLHDSARCSLMSEAGIKLVEANSGATEKTMALVAAALGES
jgi:3-deoxy-D-manno-octulosonic-acid transferase